MQCKLYILYEKEEQKKKFFIEAKKMPACKRPALCLLSMMY